MLQPDPSTLKHRTLYPFSILVPYSEVGVDLEVGLELEKQWPKQMVKSTWEKRVPNGSEKNEPKKKKKVCKNNSNPLVLYGTTINIIYVFIIM